MTKTLCISAVLALAGAASAQFYGGDFDGRNGLSDEFNTIVSDAWTFDDFDWSGGNVTSLFGNYLSDQGSVAGYQYEIRQGITEGNGGSLIASGDTDGSFSWSNTGPGGFGFPQMTLDADIADFNLAPGTYFLGLRPKGNTPGVGRAFIETTSGQNSVGTPIANGNTFLHSPNFFGLNYTNWETQLGPGPWDVSQGVRGIPAPGVAALMGLAGLTAGRRRRA